MTSHPLRAYYDVVDPLSWLVSEEIAALGEEAGEVEWIPFEVRPPPAPLVSLDDPAVEARWQEARALLPGDASPFDPPLLVPWSRKAHELVLHASTRDRSDEVRARLQRAYLFEARDIGRVDVLVEEAVAVGLDRTEAKAVLDVDKHDAEVAALRSAAVAAGVRVTPTLALGDRRLEGFHNRAAIRTFLGT